MNETTLDVLMSLLALIGIGAIGMMIGGVVAMYSERAWPPRKRSARNQPMATPIPDHVKQVERIARSEDKLQTFFMKDRR